MSPENKHCKLIFAMTWGLGSEEDIHLGISIIISRNYTGYGDTQRSAIKNKPPHMQITVKGVHEKSTCVVKDSPNY